MVALGAVDVLRMDRRHGRPAPSRPRPAPGLGVVEGGKQGVERVVAGRPGRASIAAISRTPRFRRRSAVTRTARTSGASTRLPSPGPPSRTCSPTPAPQRREQARGIPPPDADGDGDGHERRPRAPSQKTWSGARSARR